MIAVDTSSLVAFINGDEGEDVELIDKALEDENLVIPPIVVAELLSAKTIPEATHTIIEAHPVLPLKDGFWKRAGENRGEIIRNGKKANLADSMIATFCLDNNFTLISRDRDYRHFTHHFGLIVKSDTGQ